MSIFDRVFVEFIRMRVSGNLPKSLVLSREVWDRLSAHPEVDALHIKLSPSQVTMSGVRVLIRPTPPGVWYRLE